MFYRVPIHLQWWRCYCLFYLNEIYCKTGNVCCFVHITRRQSIELYHISLNCMCHWRQMVEWMSYLSLLYVTLEANGWMNVISLSTVCDTGGKCLDKCHISINCMCHWRQMVEWMSYLPQLYVAFKANGWIYDVISRSTVSDTDSNWWNYVISPSIVIIYFVAAQHNLFSSRQEI